MFNNTYDLKGLWDHKSAQLRNRLCRENGSQRNSSDNVVSDSTFLGPILWDDVATISDLDNINLDEFSPSLLESSFTPESKSPASFENLVKDVMEMSYTDKEWETDCYEDKLFSAGESISSSPGKTHSSSTKKTIVPIDQKNDKYWARRMKNNAAAKRSRDARRKMESQVYMKASALEIENEKLKCELNRLREENKLLHQLFGSSVSVSSSAEGPHFTSPTPEGYHAHSCSTHLQSVIPPNFSATQHSCACHSNSSL